MADFRELLTIEPKKEITLKNRLKVWMKWDSNDADYIELTEEMDPKVLFENKKLIFCLAYITCPYNFKGHDWNAKVFCSHIRENEDIDDLAEILEYNDFVVYTDIDICHSCKDLEITYYDFNGKPWDINFDNIHKKWENMTYEEICEQINKM